MSFTGPRRALLFAPDRSLTLDFDFLLDSGNSIAGISNKGPVPTFTRASNAMSFDSIGNLAFAPHNLILQTEDLTTTWALAGAGPPTRTATSFSPVAQFDNIGQNFTTREGVTYKLIADVKSADSTNALTLLHENSATGNFTADIQNLTATFTEISITFLGRTGGGNVNVGFQDRAASGFGTIDIRNIRVIIDGSDETYYATTTSAFYGPRFVHDPNDGNARLGLLEEQEARTNLCLQSSTFGTTWANTNTDEPTTNNTDIFGGTTADEIATTSTADQVWDVHQSFTGLTANIATTVAVHIKTGTNVTFVQLVWDSDGGGTDGCFCNFELTGAGTKGTVTAFAAGTATVATIALIVEGFYRVTLTGDIDVGAVGRFSIGLVDRITAVGFEAGDLADNDSVIVCAADVQVGGFMMSHIPTTTVSVTRAKDVRSTTDLSWLNANAGTMFKQGIIPHVSAAERTLWVIDDNSNTNLMRLYLDAAENGNFETVTSGDTNGASDGAAVIAVDTVFKLAGTYKDDSVIGYVDGTASTEDTSAGIPVNGAAAVSRWGNDGASLTSANMITQAEKYWNVVKPAVFVEAETT